MPQRAVIASTPKRVGAQEERPLTARLLLAPPVGLESSDARLTSEAGRVTRGLRKSGGDLHNEKGFKLVEVRTELKALRGQFD
jgi:hypothetical protein